MDPENPSELAAPSTQELLQTLVGKLSGWLEALVANLPNLVIAFGLMAAAWFVSRWIASAVQTGLQRVSKNRQLADLVGSVSRIAILGLALFAALGILQLDKTVTSLLAGVGILGIALGFAVQDLVANLISGSIMAVRRPFRVGDLIETNDFTAVVKSVDLRATHFRLLTGEALTIPNNQIFSNPIINRTRVPKRRIDLAIGVAYGDDLQQAKSIMMDALTDLPGQTDDEPEVYFTGFGGSSVDAVARFWVATTSQAKWLNSRSEAIISLKTNLDNAGITIPFPIRTLDFGVVGGEPLAKHLVDLDLVQSDDDETMPAAAKKPRRPQNWGHSTGGHPPHSRATAPIPTGVPLFTKTFTIACALLVSTTAFAGPRTQLVKQLPTDTQAEAFEYESEIFRLEGALASKRAQLEWADDYKHVSETEIFAIESMTQAVVTENPHSEGATISYDTDHSLEHLGDVEVDARVADEYLVVLDEQEDALQARLELAEARRDLFLAKEIAEHVKDSFNVERFERRKVEAVEEFMDAFTDVTEAEAAYRRAGGNRNIDPLITLENQYELKQGTDDWDEEENITLQ